MICLLGLVALPFLLASPYATYQAADIVMGQADFTSVGVNGISLVSPCSLSYPRGGAIAGGKWVLSDTLNNRVLIFNSKPTTDFPAADVVIGQPDFTTNQPNRGGIGAAALYSPTGVCSDGTSLVVADRMNNRVLVWTSIPSSSGQPADIVIGQADVVSNLPNCGASAPSAASLNSPTAVAIAGASLIVSDSGNNRVLIWNTMPSANGTAADLVLGQPDFLSNEANNGGPSASSLSRPTDVVCAAGRTFIVDTDNNRVLIHNTLPSGTNEAADVVVGQSSFTATEPNSPALDGTSLNYPNGVSSDGTILLIADTWNNRVLVYTPIPSANGACADLVVGQSDLTSMECNSPSIGAGSLFWPYSVVVIGTTVLVLDTYNSRALLFDPIPVANGEDADIVLGQPSFAFGGANTALPSPAAVDQPMCVLIDGYRALVGDSGNNRVLLWSTIPAGNGAPADLVLGQSDLYSNARNQGGITASSLGYVDGLASDGKRLFVSDSGNARVLVWNTMPVSNGQPADIVLGQPDFGSNDINPGGVSEAGFAWPCGIATDGVRLVVSDWDNNRTMIWNSIPQSSFAQANVMLGQPDTVSNTPNNGGVSASSLSWPYGAAIAGERLFVCDYGNNRVLVWNSFPLVHYQPADIVIGQPDFGSNTPNHGGLSIRSLNGPSGVATDGLHLFICDCNNHRVLVWDAFPSQNFAPADAVLGQWDFGSSSPNHQGVGDRSLSGPNGIASDGTRMLVADTDNNRILIHSRQSGPTAPAIVSASCDGVQAVLAWSPCADIFGISHYEVEVDDCATFGLPAVVEVYATTTQTSITVPSLLLAAGTHYWRVRGVSTKTYYSEWSSPGSFVKSQPIDSGPTRSGGSCGATGIEVLIALMLSRVGLALARRISRKRQGL